MKLAIKLLLLGLLLVWPDLLVDAARHYGVTLLLGLLGLEHHHK